MAAASSFIPAERQWFIVSRWQEFAGEARTNLVRVLAIACFYAVELLNYYVWSGVESGLHLAITALTVAWTMLAAGVFYCLRLKLFPGWLKFLSTAGDILLLTSILTLASGPASSLVVVYFVILASAALRFSLSLLWFATGLSCAGYVFLLGYAKWAANRPEMTVPRLQQVLFLVSLILSGVVLGQVVRRVRALAEDYANRLRAYEPAQGTVPSTAASKVD